MLIIRWHKHHCWTPLFYRFPAGWQINLGKLELRWMYKS